MAEKMSTLVVKADLECTKCYNKLRRTLCEYHYEIRSQLIDRKQNTVTISGPFDAQEFAQKLNKRAGKAIRSIEIKKKEEEKPKPKEPAKKADDKPAEKKADNKPAEKKAEDKPAQKKGDNKPAEKKAEDKPAEKKAADDKPKKATPAAEPPKSDPPKAAEPTPAKAAEPGPGMKYVEPGTVLAYPMVQPYGGYTVPCYEGYVGGGPVHDGYGRPYDGGYGGSRGYYNNTGYNNNNNNSYSTDYFSERDPTCSIM